MILSVCLSMALITLLINSLAQQSISVSPGPTSEVLWFFFYVYASYLHVFMCVMCIGSPVGGVTGDCEQTGEC